LAEAEIGERHLDRRAPSPERGFHGLGLVALFASLERRRPPAGTMTACVWTPMPPVKASRSLARRN